MKKIITVSALSLILAAACVFGVLFTVQSAVVRSNGEYSFAVDAEVMKKGSTGSEVKKVQQKLKNWGYYSGSVDGIYGSQTKKAVEYFQRKNGLAVDGIVGKKTFAALGISTSSSSSSGGYGNYSNADMQLLARCIYAEARGESYTGQVAVGAVILNRVKSSQFPNTISGVIYQKGAFTAVSDGQINLAPDQTAMNAAKDAVNGWDPSYGCLYYYNPAVATSSWIFSRETVTVIGKHVFAL